MAKEFPFIAMGLWMAVVGTAAAQIPPTTGGAVTPWRPSAASTTPSTRVNRAPAPASAPLPPAPVPNTMAPLAAPAVQPPGAAVPSFTTPSPSGAAQPAAPASPPPHGG